MLPNTLGLGLENCCYIGNIPGEQSVGVKKYRRLRELLVLDCQYSESRPSFVISETKVELLREDKIYLP